MAIADKNIRLNKRINFILVNPSPDIDWNLNWFKINLVAE